MARPRPAFQWEYRKKTISTELNAVANFRSTKPLGRMASRDYPESLGRILDPGPTGGLKKGDLVVGILRRPDLCHVPTAPWANGTYAAMANTPSAALNK